MTRLEHGHIVLLERTDREGIRAEHTRLYVSRLLVFKLIRPSEGEKTTLTELGNLTPMGGALQTHTSCFWRLHLTDDALLSLEIASSHRKLMSTSLQGASGPSGHAGLPPAFGQPAVSGNDTAPKPALT